MKLLCYIENLFYPGRKNNKVQRHFELWDQENYFVISGFCFISVLYNESPLYVIISLPTSWIVSPLSPSGLSLTWIKIYLFAVRNESILRAQFSNQVCCVWEEDATACQEIPHKLRVLESAIGHLTWVMPAFVGQWPWHCGEVDYLRIDEWLSKEWIMEPPWMKLQISHSTKLLQVLLQLLLTFMCTVKAPVFGNLNSAIGNFQTWFGRTVMELLKYCWM